MHAQAFGCFKDREVFPEAEPNSFCLLLSGESSSLSVHGVYCGVSRRLNDLSIEPGEDQCLSKGEGELDSESRFALTFFESYGYTERDFGDAEGLAKARNISVEGVAKAGILRSLAGKSWLLKRENLDGDWDPALDARLCVWEATQHLIKRLESGGEGAAGDLLKQLKKISGHGDLTSNCRALAYRLYSHCDKTKQAEEARAYNGLVIAWPELEKLAAASASPVQPSLL